MLKTSSSDPPPSEVKMGDTVMTMSAWPAIWWTRFRFRIYLLNRSTDLSHIAHTSSPGHVVVPFGCSKLWPTFHGCEHMVILQHTLFLEHIQNDDVKMDNVLDVLFRFTAGDKCFFKLLGHISETNNQIQNHTKMTYYCWWGMLCMPFTPLVIFWGWFFSPPGSKLFQQQL